LIIAIAALGIWRLAHHPRTYRHPFTPKPLVASPSPHVLHQATALRPMTNAINLGDLETPGQFAATRRRGR
jgi:hypothetical protein